MLPEDTLSTEPVNSAFEGASALPITQWVDYEDGGIAIQDGTLGLLYQVWRAEIKRNKTTGLDEIWIGAEKVDPFLHRTAADITEVSLSFDRNMNLALAYVESDVAYLYWFDTTIPGYRTTTLGADVKTPRVTHDDKRELQSQNSDVILAYLKNGNLYYRQQRDRYETERLLQASVNSPGLVKIGMNKQLRLQFLLRY